MYSRYSANRPSDEISIPKNYSGCAFTQRRESDGGRTYIEIAKPTPPKDSALPPPIPLPPEEEGVKETEEDGKGCITVAPLSKSQDSHSAPPPLKPLLPSIPVRFDSDQILLLGLILLLLGNDGDGDLILCLGLLLLWH